MKKLLLITLLVAPLIQASITQEDAIFLLDKFIQVSIAQEDATFLLDEMGVRKYQQADGNLARSLVRFAKVCTFNTSGMTKEFNWNQRSGLPGTYTSTSINCSQLADIMETMAKNTEKYDSEMIDRLEKTINEIRPT